MLASGLFKLEIWLDCNQTLSTIGRRTVVFSFLVRNFLFPKIIRVERRTNIGIPTINDHTARLKLPINISSNISAMIMIEMKIRTLTIPRNVRIIIHICSKSFISSGLSRADNLSMNERPLMESPAHFI